ncbi:MAG TPA: cell envelope biogenesis protein OmpA, partial [Archangium sp.]
MRQAALLLLAVSMLASPAGAQSQSLDPLTTRGIDLVPFKFTPSMDSGLTVEGGELLQTRSFFLQALVDMNVGILTLKNGEERIGDLVPFRTDVHIMGAYQLHPRIEVAADLPIFIAQASNFALLT